MCGRMRWSPAGCRPGWAARAHPTISTRRIGHRPGLRRATMPRHGRPPAISITSSRESRTPRPAMSLSRTGCSTSAGRSPASTWAPRVFPTNVKSCHRWGRATNKKQRRSCGDSPDFHGVSKVTESAEKTLGVALLGPLIEVGGAEVLVLGTVFEHVVGGGEDGCGHGADRLLGAAPGAQAVELGVEVAVLLFRAGPGALHQQGLEPGSALAHAVGSALASALVVARAQAGPGDEMAAGGEAAHVHSDLGDDASRSLLADAGNGGQQLRRLAKGAEIGLDLLIDLVDGSVDGVDLLEMKGKQEAVALGDTAAQGFAQLLRCRLDAAVGQFGQPGRIAFAG